jgi:hypothetical protein
MEKTHKLEKDALIKENERLGLKIAKLEHDRDRIDKKPSSLNMGEPHINPFDGERHFMDEVYKDKYNT